jgi:hypothetical protein
VAAYGFSSQSIANVKAAGTALGAQVQRLVNAGAKRAGRVYPLGLSPMGPPRGRSQYQHHAGLQQCPGLSVVDLGYNMLYLDSSITAAMSITTPISRSTIQPIACTTVLFTSARLPPSRRAMTNTLLYAVASTPTAPARHL